MPSLGADMKAGTLVGWKVKPGDRVKRGDIIAEVETEKGIIEIEVFEDGMIEEILVSPGEEVPVGTVLAIILPESEAVKPSEEIPKSDELQPEPVPVGPQKDEQTGPYKACNIFTHWEAHPEDRPAWASPKAAAEDKRIKISPSARRLAADLTVDLSTIKATGPGNAITRADVEREATTRNIKKKTAITPQSSKKMEMDKFQAGIRKAIAAAMARSNRDIPHYYLETQIDMSSALKWLDNENRKRPIKERLLPAALLIKAVALALTDVPELNAYWIDDHQEVQEAIHIGFAISLRQGGLIAPAIHHADLKSPEELMEALRDLITRTRAGKLRSSEMTDSTITVTSLGDLGVETVYGVIYPPQVAIVGLGKIMDRPWVENGMLGIRKVMTATLSGDHRATDGKRGAQFLDALNRYLQEAEKL